jgi:hypothetical protein
MEMNGVIGTGVLKECCICFSESEILFIKNDDIDFEVLSITNIKKSMFKNNIVPGDLLIGSSCSVHFMCVNCLQTMLTSYENHPINNTNCVIRCPYPFDECKNSQGFNYIIEEKHIAEILSEADYFEFARFSHQFRFPGYEVINCVGTKFDYIEHMTVNCTAELLVSIEDIKHTPKGELLVQCDQNIECMKTFCYYCRDVVLFSKRCDACIFSEENQNPNAYNRYFNKPNIVLENVTPLDVEDEFNINVLTFPEDVLLRNSEITVELAVTQLRDAIRNIDYYMICCICKTPMFKTEKCNGLSHHKIERCYVCGRIGEKHVGLANHWNTSGIGGCYRFMHDLYVSNRLRTYKCKEDECYGHEIGECTVVEHKDGLLQYHNDRVRSILLHAVQSLLPSIRFEVLDELYNEFFETKYEELLPYKQTFLLLQRRPLRGFDYSEEIIYEQLGLESPEALIGTNKRVTIDIQINNNHISKGKIKTSPFETVSAWRRNNAITMQSLPDIRPTTPFTSTFPNTLLALPSITPYNLGYTEIINVYTNTHLNDNYDSDSDSDSDNADINDNQDTIETDNIENDSDLEDIITLTID